MSSISLTPHYVNTLRLRQNGYHLADDIVKSIFLNENTWISVTIWLKFVSKGPIDGISALVQVIALHQKGNYPLPEPMMTKFSWHMYVSPSYNELHYLSVVFPAVPSQRHHERSDTSTAARRRHTGLPQWVGGNSLAPGQNRTTLGMFYAKWFYWLKMVEFAFSPRDSLAFNYFKWHCVDQTTSFKWADLDCTANHSEVI